MVPILFLSVSIAMAAQPARKKPTISELCNMGEGVLQAIEASEKSRWKAFGQAMAVRVEGSQIMQEQTRSGKTDKEQQQSDSQVDLAALKEFICRSKRDFNTFSVKVHEERAYYKGEAKEYGSTLVNLLQVGHPKKHTARNSGFTEDHVPELLRMASDFMLLKDADKRRRWAPIHAVKILGLLRKGGKQLVPLLDIPDSWLLKELPGAIAKTGDKALSTLKRYAEDGSHWMMGRLGAIDALNLLAGESPELEAPIFDIFQKLLLEGFLQRSVAERICESSPFQKLALTFDAQVAHVCYLCFKPWKRPDGPKGVERSCHHCERAICHDCSDHCVSCREIYCHVCHTVDYGQRDTRAVCIGCRTAFDSVSSPAPPAGTSTEEAKRPASRPGITAVDLLKRTNSVGSTPPNGATKAASGSASSSPPPELEDSSDDEPTPVPSSKPAPARATSAAGSASSVASSSTSPSSTSAAGNSIPAAPAAPSRTSAADHLSAGLATKGAKGRGVAAGGGLDRTRGEALGGFEVAALRKNLDQFEKEFAVQCEVALKRGDQYLEKDKCNDAMTMFTGVQETIAKRISDLNKFRGAEAVGIKARLKSLQRCCYDSMAAASHKLGQHEDVVSYADKALTPPERFGEPPKAYFYRGLAYAHMGKLEKAHADLVKALHLAPEDKEVGKALERVAESLVRELEGNSDDARGKGKAKTGEADRSTPSKKPGGKKAASTAREGVTGSEEVRGTGRQAGEGPSATTAPSKKGRKGGRKGKSKAEAKRELEAERLAKLQRELEVKRQMEEQYNHALEQRRLELERQQLEEIMAREREQQQKQQQQQQQQRNQSTQPSSFAPYPTRPQQQFARHTPSHYARPQVSRHGHPYPAPFRAPSPFTDFVPPQTAPQPSRVAPPETTATTSAATSAAELFPHFFFPRDTAAVAAPPPEIWQPVVPGGAELAWGEVERVDDSCCVCFENARDALALPCGHLSTCQDCLRLVMASDKPLCPICRQVIEELVAVDRR